MFLSNSLEVSHVPTIYDTSDGSWGCSKYYFKEFKTVFENYPVCRDSIKLRESQFSHSVMSHSLQPHGLQHARLPCPSPTPRTCSNSCPLSRCCHPTISSSVVPFSSYLQSFPASVFSNESVLHIKNLMVACWSFNFSIRPSNERSGLISFRVDWFDLFAVHGTLKRLLQHHSLKASILWHSAFFIVQLSHPYMTTGKTMALTR